MKVLYIHHCGMYGGSSRSLGIVLPYLAAKGVDVHIVSPEGPAADYFKTITPNVQTLHHRQFPITTTIDGSAKNWGIFLRGWLKARSLHGINKSISDHKPDLVHCNECGLTKIAELAFRQQLPVVMHARTKADDRYSFINRYCSKRINKNVDHLICISGSVANSFNNVQRKSIIHNPVEQIPPAYERSSNKDEVVFLSLSSINPLKGIMEILEAAKILLSDKRIRIRIAGELDDRSFSQQVLRFVDDNELTNVELIGHVQDVDAAIRESDAMLAPMQLNAPPRSVFEAGIHGVPSILAMRDKVHDVVEDDVTGLLIDEKSPSQLASAMTQLMDLQYRLRLGKAARQRSIENHEVKQCAQRIYDVYAASLARHDKLIPNEDTSEQHAASDH